MLLVGRLTLGKLGSPSLDFRHSEVERCQGSKHQSLSCLWVPLRELWAG